eukprot:COSAG05_NODE_1062_length_5993_cov_8.045640_10_plen_60_part_00
MPHGYARGIQDRSQKGGTGRTRVVSDERGLLVDQRRLQPPEHRAPGDPRLLAPDRDDVL